MTRQRYRINHYNPPNQGRDTDVSLKEYFESKLEAMGEALKLANDSLDKTLKGFPLEYMRKPDYDKEHERVCAQVAEVKRMVMDLIADIKNNVYPRLDKKAAEALMTIAITAIISGTFVALAGALIKHMWP